MSAYLILAGHILIGFYFAFYGFWNIYHWAPILRTMANRGIPHPYLFLGLGILVQTVAGYLIMFGLYVRLAALFLIPFTLLAIFIFHPFWQFRGETRALNFAIFLANATVTLGALCLLLV